MRLERSAADIRLVMAKIGRDLKEPMRAYSHERAEKLAREDLSGYIFESGSPNCGLYRMRAYGSGGMAFAIHRHGSDRGKYRQGEALRFGLAIAWHRPDPPFGPESRRRGLRD